MRQSQRMKLSWKKGAQTNKSHWAEVMSEEGHIKAEAVRWRDIYGIRRKAQERGDKGSSAEAGLLERVNNMFCLLRKWEDGQIVQLDHQRGCCTLWTGCSVSWATLLTSLRFQHEAVQAMTYFSLSPHKKIPYQPRWSLCAKVIFAGLMWSAHFLEWHSKIHKKGLTSFLSLNIILTLNFL